MPYTIVQICNIGLSKLGSARIATLEPARTALERHVSTNYMQWKETEIAAHRWVFCRVIDYPLAKTAELDGVALRFEYATPADMARPIRLKRSEWQQYGRTIRSAYDNLQISYIRTVEEADFDPLFVGVLAARIALESAEYVTQSNTKKSDASALYDKAVTEAKRGNAFTIGAEDIQDDDNDFSWVNARY